MAGARPAMHHSAWLQDFSGGSSIDLLQTPQPADFDLFLNDDERHLANAMLECSQVDSEGHTLPPPTTMSPFRQRYDMGAAHQMRPPFRTASPGQQVASWSAGSTELGGASEPASHEKVGMPQQISGHNHDSHSVRRASAPRVSGMTGSPYVDDEQCLTAADTPNPFAATAVAAKAGVSTNGTGSADSSGMHVASPSQAWHPPPAGVAVGWGERPGSGPNTVIRSDRQPLASHTVARSSLDSQGRCFPVVSGDPAVAAAEAAAAPVVPDKSSAKQTSRRAAMLRRASLGSPNDADTSSPRRRLLRRCKSTAAAYNSDTSDSDVDNRGPKKRRVKHQPPEPIEEGTFNEENVARMEHASPESLPPNDEDVVTLRQNIAQLRMENASAVAHIATLETERNELSRSFLSICRVLKQKAVDNQRLEAEIIKLRSAMGLSQGRGSAEWCQRMGGMAGNISISRPPMMPSEMAQSSTAAYAHCYPGGEGQLDAGGAPAAPVEPTPYTHAHAMVNSAGIRGMNGMTPRVLPHIADAAVHMQYPL